jgi:hypothetical protein
MLSTKLSEDLHASDQEMLMAADGELPTRRAAQVHAHLAACWDCRARMAEIEGTIADFARAHRQNLDPQLPPIAGPRALLKAHLAEMASKPEATSWWSFRFNSLARRVAFTCGVFAIAALMGMLLFQKFIRRGAYSAGTPFERGIVPDRSLTPGLTRRVSMSDVCSMAHEKVIGDVSTSLRQEVFQEYGIADAHASDYEIDYLIAPGLGGVEDIRNLWPEPYTSRTWNARVKDALEERLHQSVCSGELDLSTAQHDISTNWIAAYKKYFHTDRPLALNSRLDSVSLLGPPGDDRDWGLGN